ncbi:MAG: tetratricopeptide repeat protein, partial [Planctomycetes bacterium]|nr:tetratricopeptide repeat protein [Planctomycetota bacterium]
KTFIVEGAPGLGKTRFVDACVTEMLGYGIEVICLPDYASTQTDGMRHLIERLLLARGLSGRQRLQYRFLLASVGLSSNRKMQWELQQLSVGQIRARVFKEVLRLLGEWGEQPLVLVIDDFHTADAPLMDFVRRLSAEDSNEKKPEHLGLLLSRQIDETTRAVKPPKGTVGIRLRGLKQQEITKSLERLEPIVGAKKLALAAKTSRGHPGLFAHLAHRVLVGEKPDDKSSVPDLGAMMTRRLEALDYNALTLILYLKLLDQSTGETALRELTGLSKALFGRVRRELNKAGLLRVSRRGYSLAQKVPDDSVFPRVDPDDLLVARRNVGHKLRRSARHLPQAALLLLAGGEVEVGLSTVRDAGKQLFYVGRVETALDLYTTALSYAQSAHDRAEFLELQGDLLNKSGEFEEARKSYSQLFSEPSLSPQERVRVMRKLGGVHQRAGDNDSARKVFEEALQLLDQHVDDLDEHLHLLNELAALHLFRGDFAQSTTLANRGLELLRSGDTSSLDPRTRGLHDLNLRSVAGHILLRQFEHEAAAAEFSKSLKISESIGTLSNTSLILNNLGVAYFSGNHLRNALRVYNRAVRLAREMGDDTAVFSILCNVAGIRARLGELRAAEELLESIEEMPHPQRSKRARLFFLHTKGLIGRVTLNDCEAVWQESIELADEIPDPVIARYARVYSFENELFQGRWGRARRLLKELELLEDDDARLRRAIDSRKAYLDSLCGKAGMPTPWLTRSYVFDQASSKSSQNVDNGTLWDWIFGAYALLEQGKHADAERCVERAWAEFVRLRQPPGALECCLVLADIALRRRDATQASRWLKEARKVLSSHDTSAGSRAALVRIPFLESRLGMLGERRSRTYVSDRLVDAGGHLPVRSNVEISWLLDLIAVEQGSPRATRNLRVSRSRFVEALQPDDRTGYLARDHRLRLGLLSTQTEISKPSLPNAAEKHLNALITITQERNFRKILNVILDACESSAGTIFLDDDTIVPDSHAIEGVGNKFPKSVRTAVLRQGTGSVDDGVCVEIAPRQGRRLGVLYVHAPPNEGDGLSG